MWGEVLDPETEYAEREEQALFRELLEEYLQEHAASASKPRQEAIAEFRRALELDWKNLSELATKLGVRSSGVLGRRFRSLLEPILVRHGIFKQRSKSNPTPTQLRPVVSSLRTQLHKAR